MEHKSSRAAWVLNMSVLKPTISRMLLEMTRLMRCARNDSGVEASNDDDVSNDAEIGDSETEGDGGYSGSD